MSCQYNRTNYLTQELFQTLARIEEKIGAPASVHAANKELAKRVAELEAENLELRMKFHFLKEQDGKPFVP